jgi:flagellin
MALRINHNIAAINTNRALITNDGMLSKSLEKLSSGQKINRAADGPASLIISEQLRAQVSSIKQSIANAETAVSMLQTSESGLTEVNQLLTNIRTLAVHASNEGANDRNMLEADQLEVKNSLETIDRITRQAQFGTKKLLDGSTGANGVGTGKGVDFLEASPMTRPSPVEGYEVRVFQLGERAHIKGQAPLTQEMIDKGEQVSISEGGKTVHFSTTKGDTVEQVFGKLKSEIEAQGLDLKMKVNDDKTLEFTHNQYGSKNTFSVSSLTPGFLSKESLTMQRSEGGKDIQGSIGGQFASGEGRVLTGGGGTRVEGLKVLYTGDTVTAPDAGEGAPNAGRITVYQNSLVFQVGPNPGQSASVSLLNTNTRNLARGVVNEAGYESLHDVDVRTTVGAQSALVMADNSINEVNKVRAAMGAFQKNGLEANLRQLRVNFTELTNAESVIRDADMAEEIVEFTRNNIMMQSSVAMLAQANQVPNSVLSLLK